MWNTLLKNFVALKNKFIEQYGEDRLWDYGEYDNCIHYWASKFDYYNEMFSPLIVNEHENLILFRYNLVDTDADFWYKYDEMYRECRSVVIDKKNECLVLTPFRKFFNVNETEETQLFKIQQKIDNAKSIEISDKMDGSMQSARFYDGKVVLAGSQALDANDSFRVAIGYSLINENYEKMLKANPQFTFVFELICEEDKHVVQYDNSMRGLYLIGMRDVATGKESSYNDVIKTANKYNVKTTKLFNKNFGDCLNSLDDKKSNEAEGFVINIDGYKVKLKYNDYVNVHRMITRITSTNVIIKAVDNGTWDDLLSKIPEAYKADAIVVANNTKKYIREMNNFINALYKKHLSLCGMSSPDPANRKMFAINVLQNVDKVYAHYLISLYDGNENNYIRSKAGRYLRYHEILSNTQIIDNKRKELL